jgi:hypothetical protein
MLGDLKTLLDVAETRTLKPPSSNHRESVCEQALEEEDQGSEEQDLDMFDVNNAKTKAMDSHAQLDALANYLGHLYGDMPEISAWARTERTCPNYYDS